MKFLFNSNITDDEALIFSASNRGFRYGDSVFETMLFESDVVRYAEQHAERLLKTLTALKMHFPLFSGSEFLNRHGRLLSSANAIRKGRIRLTVFRNGSGFYTPENNTCSWLMEMQELEEITVDMPRHVILYSEEHKAVTPLSNFKTGNSLIYVLAAIHAKQCGADDCLILNTAGNVCDSIHSNVFIIKNGKLITPPLNEGCIDGIMRRMVLQTAISVQMGYTLKPLTVTDVLAADELFLTNAIKGIQPVSTFGQSTYQTDLTQVLMHNISLISPANG